MNDVVRGTVSPGFEECSAVFASFFDRGWDAGSAVSVYREGVPKARLTGGSRIGGSEPPLYDAETIQLVASTTKFVESLCIALLVDRGLLRWDDRIVDHWPTFPGGHASKELVTVRQLLMHRAGLPVFDRTLGDEELFDLDARARFLERQRQVPGLFVAEPHGREWRTQSPPPPHIVFTSGTLPPPVLAAALKTFGFGQTAD